MNAAGLDRVRCVLDPGSRFQPQAVQLLREVQCLGLRKGPEELFPPGPGHGAESIGEMNAEKIAPGFDMSARWEIFDLYHERNINSLRA
jgi:hypothetical protein